MAVKQGLSYYESQLLRRYEPDRVSQKSGSSDSNVSTGKVCGINGMSLNDVRKKRQEGDNPDGKKDWPWMAMLIALKHKNDNYCGGVILNTRYVLTAAHCFDLKETKNKEDTIVRLGEYEIKEEGETEKQEFAIEELTIHAEYDSSTHQNDIALMRLNDTIKYTQYVRPICLPKVEPKADEITIVAGWGTIYEDGPISETLLYVDVPVWDLSTCKDELGANDVFDTNICAASHDGGKDACQRDSGGPLMYQREDNKRWVTVGIVSWGQGCGEPKPAVYTSVPKFLSWIKEHMQDVDL